MGVIMYSTIILYTILIILIIYDIFVYFYDAFFGPNSNKELVKKKNLIIKDGIFTFDFYKRNAIIDVIDADIIEIPKSYNNKYINVIDINRKINCKKFIISENINVINNLKLNANEVISLSNSYHVIDNMILDKFDNVITIFKDVNQDTLLNIAKKYSISRKAIHYFSNAKYVQFGKYKGLYEFRISKPYYDESKDAFMIVPDVIDSLKVEAIAINYEYITYLNIPKNISRVVVETNSVFKKLEIDKGNSNYVIFNKALLDCEKSMFINNFGNIFKCVNSNFNPPVRKEYRRINRKYLSLIKKPMSYYVER